MKKIIYLLMALLFTSTIWAQTPQKMSYQAVIHNLSNNLITNQVVGMQISILQGSITGTPVYVETQTPTSNSNGLVSLEIGGGNVVTGSFTTINWANGPYYIKTETDPTGGTNYTISGTTQLLSVPYAMYAKSAESITIDGFNYHLTVDENGNVLAYPALPYLVHNSKHSISYEIVLDNIVFKIKTNQLDYPSFNVDVNQNAQIDAGLDRGYGITGSLEFCAQYCAGFNAWSGCGAASSNGTLICSNNEYTFSIPISELQSSSSSNTISIRFQFWNPTTLDTYYPQGSQYYFTKVYTINVR